MCALSIEAADAYTPEPTYGRPDHLEQSLHGPVLTERAVQHGEDDVDADRPAARADEAGRRRIAGERDRFAAVTAGNASPCNVYCWSGGASTHAPCAVTPTGMTS